MHRPIYPKDGSTPTALKISEALYRETYILIVYPKEIDFMEYLLLPFRPFQWKTWAAIMCSITLSLTFVYKCLQRSKRDVDGALEQPFLQRVAKFFRSLCLYTYHAIKDFTGGRIDEDEGLDTSEKLVITAFIIFAFIILVFYNGLSTASFVKITLAQGVLLAVASVS